MVTTDLSRSQALVLVLLLTLLGASLRLASLDRPVIWGDEARTFGRVFSSWQDMLGLLDEAGFMPGSYMSQWWLAQGMPIGFRRASTQPTTNPSDPTYGARPGELVATTRLAGQPIALTPRVIRAIPTVCGILMLPTMYFLARRFVSRKFGVWVVAFCAISAYLLVYSRDAKMYMQLMFAAALHLACFLWWLGVKEGKWQNQPRTLLTWLCWVASGLLMISFQMVGAVMIGIELVILLSMPRVAFWYVWPKRSAPDSVEQLHQSVWQSVFSKLAYPFRVSCPAIFGFLLGVALIGWAPLAYYMTFNHFDDIVLPQSQEDQVDIDRAGLGWVREYLNGRDGFNLMLLGSTAYTTGWEWPRPDWWDDISPDRRTLLSVGASAILILLVVGALPWRVANQRIGGAQTPTRYIRALPMVWIILGVWLSAYAIYCVSVRAASPGEAVAHLLMNSDGVTSTGLRQGTLGAYLVDQLRADQEGTESAARLIGQAWSDFKAWVSVAREPAGAGVSRFLEIERYSWWKVGLWFVAGTVTLMAYPMWTRRGAAAWLAGGGIFAIVFALSWLVFFSCRELEKPVFMPRYISVVWPLVAIGVVVLIARIPTLALRMIAIGLLVGVNAWQFSTRVWGETEPPSDWIARDLYDDRKNASMLTITSGVLRSGAPGDGNFRSSPVRYYFWLLSRDKINAGSIHWGLYDQTMGLDVLEGSPDSRIRRAVQEEELQRIVVWIESGPGRAPRDRGIQTMMRGGGFEQVRRDTFNVHDHWTWRALYTTTRMEFVRQPTKQPVSNQPPVPATECDGATLQKCPNSKVVPRAQAFREVLPVYERTAFCMVLAPSKPPPSRR